MNANELAHKVFDALYDENELNELHQKKIIAQPLGYKLSCIAIIECEIQEEHDRLTSKNARLLDMLKRLTSHDNCRKDVIHLMSEADSLIQELEKGDE